MFPHQLSTQELKSKISIDNIESFRLQTSSITIHATDKKIPSDQ